MNAVIKDENSKEGAFGWLQFEKKGLQELQRLALRAPMAMGVLLYLVNNMGRSNALAVSQGAMSKKLGISVRAVAGAVATLSNHNFIEVVKVGNMNVYRINSRVAWQGKRGERFAAFNAEILAFESEQPEGFDTLLPLKSVPQLQKGERLLVGNEELPRQTNRKWICHESAPTSRMLALAAR